METDMKIRASVAMAVYNGEMYIRQQVDSILERMGPNDELIISYDVSKDATRQIIDDYAVKDSRVRVVDNRIAGVQSNFSNAIDHCRGEYVFLSDQDDLWIGNKLEQVVETFEKTGADLVVHDGYMTDGDLNILPETIFQIYGTYNGPVRNTIKCSFWGCCMAFRREMWKKIGPFPRNRHVPHDHWLGIWSGFYGKIVRIDECLIKHRLHLDNVTPDKRRKLTVILKQRSVFVWYLLRHVFGK